MCGCTSDLTRDHDLTHMYRDAMQNLASRSLVDEVLMKVKGLQAIAAELNVPLTQLVIAWCASNPNVSTVITGATKEHQVLFISKSTHT